MSEQILKVKDFTNKEKCDCGAVAVWCYMPSSSDKSNPYNCEECVSRGCSCEWNPVVDFGQPPENGKWKWIVIPKDERDNDEIKEGEMWAHLDEQGREYPCCEYFYSKDGWDKE